MDQSRFAHAGSLADPLRDEPFDWTYKGLAAADEGLTAAELGARRRHLFDDLSLFPLAVLSASAIRSNSEWMRKFIQTTGVQIAPHGKTTLAPELFGLQLDDGAWGLTAATVHHVRAYRQFGVRRILMANQLIGEGGIAWVLQELADDPEFDFYCLVDSVAGVEALRCAAAARGAKRPIQVLIEVGRPRARAGVRSVAEGLQVAAAAVAAAPYVKLVGVETFEGVVQSEVDGAAKAAVMIEQMLELARACDARGDFSDRIILTAGGTGFFDLATQALAGQTFSVKTEAVIRSGCYLTHDDGMYGALYGAAKARSPAVADLGFDLKPALQVWAYVQSVPEPGRTICGLGRRDVGSESGMPRLVAWARPGDAAPRPAPAGYTVSALYDQHTLMDGPVESPFEVGDLVAFGVSHTCTTFDKWRAVMVVDDDYVVRDVLRTFF